MDDFWFTEISSQKQENCTTFKNKIYIQQVLPVPNSQSNSS
jgi:hypothetical protein